MLSVTSLYAQIPTTCLEIESILVDACGNPEGSNEMVRFQVGNNPLVLSSMTVSWPNNGWLGLCQNATTANVVSTWNSTITQCGRLLEPTGGIIPAGKRVILVTSTAVIPAANSFAGLSDTIYVIFQCAGNTSGHFANQSFPSGLRTLSITVGACVETVTYDRSLLVNQANQNLPADGATVVFNWAGTPSYINIGCNAPVAPQIVNAGANQTGFCQGDTVSLSAITAGSFSSFAWSGGTGTFTSPTLHNTNYIIGAGDSNPLQLYFTATNCNGGITDTVQISLNSPPPVSINPAGPVSLCTGDSVTLTATGPGPFNWSTSQSGNSITVNSAGTYIVTQTNGCGNSSDTVTVINSPLPTAVITPQGPTSLCTGGSVTLLASGGTSYQWSTSDNTASIVAVLSGNYNVIVSNSCGSDTAFITLTAAASPQATINTTSPIVLCGGSVQVTASGIGTFSWSTGTNGPNETITTPGNYYVVASNSCGTDTAFFSAITGGVTAVFTASPLTGQSPLSVNFTNGSTGTTQYSWNFGNGNISTDENPTNIYTQPGVYTAVLTASNANGCSDTVSLIIIVDSCNYAIKIPNVFTMDGNTINDQFYVAYTCIDDFNAVIFDRWGLKVFEYTDPAQQWDGTTFTGSKINSGIYHYIINVKDSNGDSHQYPGFIHVFE